MSQCASWNSLENEGARAKCWQRYIFGSIAWRFSRTKEFARKILAAVAECCIYCCLGFKTDLHANLTAIWYMRTRKTKKVNKKSLHCGRRACLLLRLPLKRLFSTSAANFLWTDTVSTSYINCIVSLLILSDLYVFHNTINAKRQ